MSLKTWIPPLLALALLGGLVLERRSWADPEDVAPYHAAVREAVEAIPMRIGPWQGREIEIPPAAVKLLRPNALLSRRYRHEEDGRQFSFLIVHCRDARDMLGHYPPVCYPAHGWTLAETESKVWSAADGPAGGVEYEFEQTLPGTITRQRVDNVMVLPNGEFGRTMDQVNSVAADRAFRVYGAAQVQFVFSSSFSAEDREAIVQRFLAASADAIDRIQDGVKQ
ncbi:MAG: exosortase-associated EpsI family protein [Phycisphaeraceae bacterium]